MIEIKTTRPSAATPLAGCEPDDPWKAGHEVFRAVRINRPMVVSSGCTNAADRRRAWEASVAVKLRLAWVSFAVTLIGELLFVLPQQSHDVIRAMLIDLGNWEWWQPLRCLAFVLGLWALSAQVWARIMTMHGRPMSPELSALATRVYGSVMPGHYWVDDQGTGGAWAHGTPRATCCVTSVAAARPGPIAVLAVQLETTASARTSTIQIPADR